MAEFYRLDSYSGRSLGTTRTLRVAKKRAQSYANKEGENVLIGKAVRRSKTSPIHFERAGVIEPKQRKQSNPSLLKKLRKGIRGTVRISRGRLIIKT